MIRLRRQGPVPGLPVGDGRQPRATPPTPACHLGDPGGGHSVPDDDVVGKVFAVVWPLGHAKHRCTRPATFAGRPRRRVARAGAVMSDAAPRSDRPPDAGLYGYERALRRAGLDPIAGRRRGRPRRLRRPAGRRAPRSCPTAGAGQVPGLADSKLLTAKARERCYDEVVRRALAWSVVVVAHEECDRLGMHVANVEALRRVAGPARRAPVVRADRRVPRRRARGARAWRCGRATGSRPASPPPRCIAKVTRDRIMTRAARGLPGVRLRDAQGLHHRRAHRGARGARPVRRSTGALRQRARAAAGLDDRRDPGVR